MKSRIIMGSAIGLAALAVTIDHTKHKLPDPDQSQQNIVVIDEGDGGSNPCGLGDTSPCGM